MLGISVDSPPANKRWAEDIAVTFPLLSDMTHKVLKDYGIMMEIPNLGPVARRSTFVVDGQGVIQSIMQDKEAIDPSGAHAVCARLKKG